MSNLIGGDRDITFEQAVKILKEELDYPEERAMHFVKRFDKNKDGLLSQAEFEHFRSKIQETKSQMVPKFKEYDRDGNGYITLEEASQILQKPPFNFPSSKPELVIILLKQFDADGNGKLSIEEFAAFYAEIKAINEDVAAEFDRLDKDKNGVLSPDEVVVVIKEIMHLDDVRAAKMVEMFDQNQDGSLDKQEFMQMWSSMFGQ